MRLCTPRKGSISADPNWRGPAPPTFTARRLPTDGGHSSRLTARHSTVLIDSDESVLLPREDGDGDPEA